MKESYARKCQIIFNLCSMKFCVDLEKYIVRNMLYINYLLDNGRFIGSILMDLSVAYDCLLHNLLLDKLQANGFSKEGVRLVLSYLMNRTQRINIGSTFSDRTNILKYILQGSILGVLLFNIFINGFGLFLSKM